MNYSYVKGPGDFDPPEDTEEFEPTDEALLERSTQYIEDDAEDVAECLIEASKTHDKAKRDVILSHLIAAYVMGPRERLIEEHYDA